jgi:uncharacterized membrane protein
VQWSAETAALAGIVAVAAVLRFVAIGHQGFWYDEAHTGWMLRLPFGEMLGGVPKSESTPPLYYVIAWLWARVFGDGEAGLRSLSAVAGVATVPCAFAAARLLAGRRAALLCAGLLTVNPLLVWYSQEARAYSLLVLTSTVAFWLFARAHRQTSGGRLAAWAAAAIVAMWTHYFAAFLVMPEAAILLLRPGVRWRARALTSACLVAAVVPLVAMAFDQRQHALWIHRIPVLARVREVAEMFTVGFSPPAGTAAVVAGLAVVAGAVALLVARGTGLERRAAAIAGAVGVGAVVLPLLAIAAGVDYFNARNVIAAVVPLAVAVAAGLAVPRARAAGTALALVIAATSVVCVAQVWSEGAAQRPEWDRVAQALGALPQPRAILLVGGSGNWAIPLAFHLNRTWWLPRKGARVREIDAVGRLGGPVACPAWWGPLCNLPRDRVSRRPPAPGFRYLGTEAVAGFSITRFRARRPIRLYPRRPYRRPHLLLTPAAEPVIL